MFNRVFVRGSEVLPLYCKLKEVKEHTDLCDAGAFRPAFCVK